MRRHWKTIFDGKQPSMEDGLQWMNNGEHPPTFLRNKELGVGIVKG